VSVREMPGVLMWCQVPKTSLRLTMTCLFLVVAQDYLGTNNPENDELHAIADELISYTSDLDFSDFKKGVPFPFLAFA